MQVPVSFCVVLIIVHLSLCQTADSCTTELLCKYCNCCAQLYFWFSIPCHESFTISYDICCEHVFVVTVCIVSVSEAILLSIVRSDVETKRMGFSLKRCLSVYAQMSTARSAVSSGGSQWWSVAYASGRLHRQFWLLEVCGSGLFMEGLRNGLRQMDRDALPQFWIQCGL